MSEQKKDTLWDQLKSTILLLALTTIVVLLAALAKTENQRYALYKYECEDPLFKSHDVKCLEQIHTREHWWQHVYAAFKN